MASLALTSEAIERGYNNRAAVPDHPRFLEQWLALSRQARERYAPQRDLRYGPNPRETLDLFLPGGTPRGTFLFVHGGYWRAFGKDDFSFVAPVGRPGLRRRRIDYDLCPDVTVATIVDECRRALLWLAGEGVRHGAGVRRGRRAFRGRPPGRDDVRHRLGGARRARAPFVGRSRSPACTTCRRWCGSRTTRTCAWTPPTPHGCRRRPSAAGSAPLLVACGADETSEFLRQSQLLWEAWPAIRRPHAGGPLVVPGRHHYDIVLDHTDPQSALTQSLLALFPLRRRRAVLDRDPGGGTRYSAPGPLQRTDGHLRLSGN